MQKTIKSVENNGLKYYNAITENSEGRLLKIMNSKEPMIIKISQMDKNTVEAAFGPNRDSELSICRDGLAISANCRTTDPSIKWNICDMFKKLGYDEMPFDTAAVTAMAVKIKSTHLGYFEVFFAVDEIYEPTGNYSAGSMYEGGDDWEYVIVDFSKSGSKWSGKINNGFRIDWTGFADPEDSFCLSELYFFENAAAAEEYLKDRAPKKKNPGKELCFEPEVPEKTWQKGYYVCLHERQLVSREYNILQRYDTLEEAKQRCDENKVYGYRVADETGKLVYLPYTLLQCNLLREHKWVTDYVHYNGFTYGDAPVNPGIDHRAKKVSCDRLVCWALYRLGFVDQPTVQGVVVSAFPDWCIQNGFERVEDVINPEPGDVMLVRPHPKGFPLHAFTYAGYSEPIPEKDIPDFPQQPKNPEITEENNMPLIFSYRYDCGSDARIQKVQPSREILYPGAYTPVCIYRPVVTKTNNIFYEYYKENENL